MTALSSANASAARLSRDREPFAHSQHQRVLSVLGRPCGFMPLWYHPGPVPSIPEKLRSLADGISALAEEVADEGNTVLALDLFRIGATLRRTAEGLAAGLRVPNQSGNVRDMVTAERLRHSKGSTNEDPLKTAANDAGFTIRSLAERLDVSHATLSLARRGKRSIERAMAEEIQKLTGFPATKKNWPGIKG